MIRKWNVALLTCVPLLVIACGPSYEEVDRRIDERFKEIFTRLPTAIPIVVPTLLPTPSPIPTPSPAPTATPQPTATPFRFQVTPPPLPPTPQPRPTKSLSDVYQKSWPSVFFIETPEGHGSGWLIEPGLVLTNEHVVRGNSEVTVRQPEHQAFIATVLAVDSLRDIALLQFDAKTTELHSQAEPLPLGQITSNNIAESLISLGYSSGRVKSDGAAGSAAANVGVLSQVINFGDSSAGLNLVLDAALDPGDSGGPVLNSDGHVVGMARAARERTLGGQRVVGTFFAVHIDEILATLPGLEKGQSR